MHPDEIAQARKQLNFSVFGNWRKGVQIMGGGHIPWGFGK